MREVRGEGQDDGQRGGGGCATNAILMMKMVGRPGNEDDVSIHNVHTIAPRYGELLALLVIPTWLLHWFPRFEPALEPRSLAWNLPLSVRYLRYIAAPLLVPARGSCLDGCLTGLVTLTSTHMYGYLLYIHMCDGECEHS